MPYDEKLAERIRELIPADIDFSERKMFGGLAFLAGGHMAIAASGEGGILVRCGPEKFEKLAREAEVETAVMRGREMKGWLRVPASKLTTKRQLQRWVDLSVAYVGTLPAKR